MSTTRKVLGLLADGVPRGVAEIAKELGPGNRAVEGACYRSWKKGVFLRSRVEVFGQLTRFRGRSLILSGLYGLVTLRESIQLYECKLEELRSFYDNWVKDNLLTKVLLDYIESNNISSVIARACGCMLLNCFTASASDSASIFNMMYFESRLDQYSTSNVFIVRH